MSDWIEIQNPNMQKIRKYLFFGLLFVVVGFILTLINIFAIIIMIIGIILTGWAINDHFINIKSIFIKDEKIRIKNIIIPRMDIKDISLYYMWGNKVVKEIEENTIKRSNYNLKMMHSHGHKWPERGWNWIINMKNGNRHILYGVDYNMLQELNSHLTNKLKIKPLITDE